MEIPVTLTTNHPSTRDDAVAGPLTGIRVLDISTVYAAPITAMLLGDYGADIVKVEHPRGDPARTHGWSPQRAGTVVEGHRPQQAGHDPELRHRGGPGHSAPPRGR